MKKILFIAISLLFTSNSSAQVSNQIKNYFKDNILQLDPLEGVYSSRFFIQDRGGGFSKRWSETSEVAIKRESNGDLRIIENEQLTFKRIGDTNAYDVYAKWEAATATCRGILSNGVSFNYEYRLPEAQLRYDGEDPNSIIYIGGELIKKYPTASMYADAIKKAQEQAKPTEWTGTGFALKDNYIATNYHVVDGAKSISVLGVNGDFTKRYNANVIATDKNIDLAIIKINGIMIPSANIPYSVKTTNAEVGEEVFVLGYPMTSTMGEEIKLTTGVVSSRSGFQGDVSLYQTTAPIQPGNSGGPLFDSKGNVIGVVSAKHTGAENVGYAIKASYLRNLMESALSTNILPQNNRIAGQNLSGKVKVAKNYVYYITCSSKKTNDIGTNQSQALKETEKSSTSNNILIKAKEYTKSADLHYHIEEYANAVEFLQKAVNLGYSEAQYKLGYMYQYGLGVKKNYIKALQLYKKAAGQNYMAAFCNIGYMYENGLGVPNNSAKAVEWYLKGADLGDEVCQDNIGLHYEEGDGVAKSYTKAFEFYLKSADKGYAKAQYHLGGLYEKGRGVKKDISKAIEWYEKASGNGNNDAEKALKRLVK